MELLYHDPHLAVCVKPVGIDSEHGMPKALTEMLGGDFYCIHRLDRNVAGVMVYARDRATAAHLSRAVAEGQTVKEYVALVHGTPPEEGQFTDLLFKDAKKNKVFVVNRPRQGVREARLSYIRLRAGDPSLVRIRLETGRSHQIRVQFASRKYPLVGDRKYGARDDAPTPMLYACALTFPYAGKPHTFTSLPAWAE